MRQMRVLSAVDSSPKMKVFRAVGNLPNAWTTSIKEQVRFDPLAYLRELEREGLVRVTDGPHGNLGYKWALTPKGRLKIRVSA